MLEIEDAKRIEAAAEGLAQAMRVQGRAWPRPELELGCWMTLVETGARRLRAWLRWMRDDCWPLLRQDRTADLRATMRRMLIIEVVARTLASLELEHPN